MEEPYSRYMKTLSKLYPEVDKKSITFIFLLWQVLFYPEVTFASENFVLSQRFMFT